MDSTKKSKQNYRESSEAFEGIARTVLDSLELISKSDIIRVSKLTPLLGSICTNSLALSMCSQTGMPNEAIMLARPCLEKVINYAYLILCDEEEYQRFFEYSSQRAVRALSNEINSGEKSIQLKYLKQEEVNKNATSILKKFTKKNNKENRNWTGLSPNQRISFISERLPINQELAMMVKLKIYDNSSEALHGTWLGINAHCVTNGTQNKDDSIELIQKKMMESQTGLFCTLGLMNCDILSKIFSLDKKPNSLIINKLSILKKKLTKILLDEVERNTPAKGLGFEMTLTKPLEKQSNQEREEIFGGITIKIKNTDNKTL